MKKTINKMKMWEWQEKLEQIAEEIAEYDLDERELKKVIYWLEDYFEERFRNW